MADYSKAWDELSNERKLALEVEFDANTARRYEEEQKRAEKRNQDFRQYLASQKPMTPALQQQFDMLQAFHDRVQAMYGDN